MPKFFIFADGSCEPINPCGACASAFVVISNEGGIVHESAKVIGIGRGMTNNVAELAAIADALKWAATQDCSEVVVRSDSKFAVYLLNGRWRANSDKPYYAAFQEAQNAVTALKSKGVRVRFEWVPREDNFMADELAFNAAVRAWEEFEQAHPEEANRLRRYGRWTGKTEISPTNPIKETKPVEVPTNIFLADLEKIAAEPSTLPAKQLPDKIACLCGGLLRLVGRSYKCSQCNNPLPAVCHQCGRVLQVTQINHAKCVGCGVAYTFNPSRRAWLLNESAFDARPVMRCALK